MTDSPAELHRLAHRAAARQRHDDGSWGAPIVTALAAVAMAEHPPAHRASGTEALDALDRWLAEGKPRRVSADVVAVCLAARAAAAYGRSGSRRVADAASHAADVATRAVVPPLHLALVCWALDDLVADRRAHPWAALRSMPARPTVGPERALMVYVEHVAAESFDAAGLVREFTASGAGRLRPGPEDGAILLWLLTAVIDKAAPYLAGDNALHALVDQRADLVARLALELGEASFVLPDWADEADSGRWDGSYLSPIEAFLIDIALSSPDREESWLTYGEAQVLFGKEAAVERLTARRWRSAFAATLTSGGGLAAALVYVIAVHTQGASAEVAWWAAASVFFLVASLACFLWRGEGHGATYSNTLMAGAVSAGLASALLLGNSVLPRPLVSDAPGLFLGLVVPAAAMAITAAVTRSR